MDVPTYLSWVNATGPRWTSLIALSEWRREFEMPLGQQMPRVGRNNTPLAVYAEQEAQREMTQPVTTTGTDCSLTDR
jgi:hypothetical protein